MLYTGFTSNGEEAPLCLFCVVRSYQKDESFVSVDKIEFQLDIGTEILVGSTVINANPFHCNKLLLWPINQNLKNKAGKRPLFLVSALQFI